VVERQPEGAELRLVPARAEAEHEAPPDTSASVAAIFAISPGG
jgi:hypothetical protein